MHGETKGAVSSWVLVAMCTLLACGTVSHAGLLPPGQQSNSLGGFTYIQNENFNGQKQWTNTTGSSLTFNSINDDVNGNGFATYGAVGGFATAQPADQNPIGYMNVVAGFSENIAFIPSDPSLLGKKGFAVLNIAAPQFKSISAIAHSKPSDATYIHASALYTGTVTLEYPNSQTSDVFTGSESQGPNGESMPLTTHSTIKPMPFIWGETLSLSMTLNFTISASQDFGDPLLMTSSLLDFNAPWRWGGISQVNDAGGNIITGWHVDSSTGFDYANAYTGPGPVPEPATAVVLGGLLVAGAFVRPRRHRV